MDKTPPTEEFPEIQWEQDVLIERDSEERERTYKMLGMDASGNKYEATGVFVCGKLELIHDIELLTINNTHL